MLNAQPLLRRCLLVNYSGDTHYIFQAFTRQIEIYRSMLNVLCSELSLADAMKALRELKQTSLVSESIAGPSAGGGDVKKWTLRYLICRYL
jgi:hypothetical protein